MRTLMQGEEIDQEVEDGSLIQILYNMFCSS